MTMEQPSRERVEFEDRIAEVIDEDAMKGDTPGGNLDAQIVIDKSQQILDEIVVDMLSPAMDYLSKTSTEVRVIEDGQRDEITESLDELDNIAEKLENSDMEKLLKVIRLNMDTVQTMTTHMENLFDADPDEFIKFATRDEK